MPGAASLAARSPRRKAIAPERGLAHASPMLALLLSLAAAQAAPAAPLPSDPVEADWRAIPDNELLVVQLAGGKRVVIRLAAAHAPQHVANIRRLAQARWWDGLSVYRVQENWVAQWGDRTEKKPLPAGAKAAISNSAAGRSVTPAGSGFFSVRSPHCATQFS
jgi:hypothetical protein